LALRDSDRIIREHNETLQREVAQRIEEALQATEITIHSLIQLLEVRNIETSNHAKRSSRMMAILCNGLQEQQIEGYELSEKTVQELVRTAPLHDIGKVGIPDSILLKPARLTEEEYAIMKQHVLYGAKALEYQSSSSEEAIAFIGTAKLIILHHHERYDGTGYPQGLSGDDIPLPGRLMAIIDVYDALTSDRVYKKAITHEQALEIIRQERGRHFDPVITDVFISLGDRIRETSRQWR
jgi:putative two-component system response regulator